MSTGKRRGDRGAEQPRPAPVTRVDLAALYQQHHATLRRHAAKVLPGDMQHEADAALMTVFTRLVTRKQKGLLTEQVNWEAYLVRAVTNACIDILKTAANEAELDKDDARIHRGTPRDPTGDEVADRIDHDTRVRRATAALEKLVPRLRTILIGKHYHERSNRDIGSQLGLTGQRVGQLHKLAIQQLREELNRHDG